RKLKITDWGEVLIGPDCVFEASLVPETCRDRFVDSREYIDNFLEGRITGHLTGLFEGGFTGPVCAFYQCAERRARWSANCGFFLYSELLCRPSAYATASESEQICV